MCVYAVFALHMCIYVCLFYVHACMLVYLFMSGPGCVCIHSVYA